ncbi:unnamed protein product [Blepharisma stoltei]|uniref:Uncharacterized protein n=1 Tax=Blepharisma stoltei TaxID=1481888 RepID=A0AAU9JER6_9CILI|nr:unnamed protein product [Blepharisma stoltei]
MKAFRTIVDSNESYRKVPNTFFSAIGLSFYEQILPEETVHVGFSSSAIHWLSEPLSAPDHIIPSAFEDSEFLALASISPHKKA